MVVCLYNPIIIIILYDIFLVFDSYDTMTKYAHKRICNVFVSFIYHLIIFLFLNSFFYNFYSRRHHSLKLECCFYRHANHHISHLTQQFIQKSRLVGGKCYRNVMNTFFCAVRGFGNKVACRMLENSCTPMPYHDVRISKVMCHLKLITNGS